LVAGRYTSATETDAGAAGIYLIPVLGGEPRPMTSAKAPACLPLQPSPLSGRPPLGLYVLRLLQHGDLVPRRCCGVGCCLHAGGANTSSDPPGWLDRRPRLDPRRELCHLRQLCDAKAVASRDRGRPTTGKDRVRRAERFRASDGGLFGPPRLRSWPRRVCHLPVRSGTPARDPSGVITHSS
jgi:hypothetical protein